MPTTVVNAVFQGGGVKGISLVGAVRSAELHGIIFNRVAGTSSGSIVAALLAAGYTGPEMKQIVEATPFTAFLQRNPIFNAKFVGPAVRLLLRKGLYSGDALEEWIRTILLRKGVRTFGDLPPGKLRIIASDITNGRLLVLPADIADYDVDPAEFEVARAIRMSTSIPYFFDPVIIRQRRGAIVKKSYVVDGGLLSNFPLWLFDNEADQGKPIPVIGFQMVGRTTAQPHRIYGPVTMFQAMFDTMLSAHDERYIEEHDAVRTIKIPALGVGVTQFDLTPQMSESLYLSGMQAGDKFFRSRDLSGKQLRVRLQGSPIAPNAPGVSNANDASAGK